VPPPGRENLLECFGSGNEDSVNTFVAGAIAKSLLLQWAVQQGLHNNTGLKTPYEMLKHYQK
jgi:hypothetical protein